VSWVKNPPAITSVTGTVQVNSATSQGWLIDQGTSSVVNTVLAVLTIETITSIDISPDDPSAGADTNYDVIFTADTDIPTGSTVVITLPTGVTVSSSNAGGSTSLDTCADLFDPTVALTCVVGTDANGDTTVTVTGLFPDTENSGQFGIDLGILTNPSTTGTTGPFQIDIITAAGDAVASEDSGTAPTTEINTVIGKFMV
jgi:hypothetical protein